MKFASFLFLFLLAAVGLEAQTVAGERVRLNAAPCTISSVNGTPDKIRLDDCSVVTTGGSSNLTLNPAGDLVLQPAGADVLPNAGYTVNLGALSNKYLALHASELWVETLVAQNTMATIGGRFLVGPTTTLTQDVGASDGWVEVKHNQWRAGDTLYAEANGSLEYLDVSWGVIAASHTGPNWIGMSNFWPAEFGAGVQFNIVGGACAGTWTSTGATYNSGTNQTEIGVSSAPPACTSGQLTWRTDPTDGNYRYFVIRNRDGSGANTWSAGDAVFNTGTVGDGMIDLYSAAGVLSGNGPAIVGNVRTGSTYNQIAARWAIGNLNGLYGYGATTYGAAFGDPSATNVTVDATNGFRIRSGTTNKFQADTAGNLSIVGDLSVGTSGVIRSGATGYSTGNGFWFDYNAGTPRFRVGNPAGNRLTWDGTTLTFVGDGAGLTSINGGAIQTGTITATQIASNAVTAAKINVSTLDAITANMGHFTSGSMNIGSGAFTLAGNGDTHIAVLDVDVLQPEDIIVQGDMTVVSGGNINFSPLGGGGDQFVCVDNGGNLYASPTVCN